MGPSTHSFFIGSNLMRHTRFPGQLLRTCATRSGIEIGDFRDAADELRLKCGGELSSLAVEGA